jgi:carboxymethylenebutenolidase
MLAESVFTPAEQSLIDLMNMHQYAEFVLRDPDAALATMVDEPYVINFPVGIGGYGKEGVRDFYANHFIPTIPPDFTPVATISQTVGQNRLVTEAVGRFTHTTRMDWMLPGIEPTGKVIEITIIAIITFRDGKVATEHIYWDQASALVQLGLLDTEKLPVLGIESSQLALNPASLDNKLIHRKFSAIC